MAHIEQYPDWLRLRAPEAGAVESMETLTAGLGLHTVCQSALCPNQGECFAKGTATFLLLGDICTRACGFCAVEFGSPSPVDPTEPERIVEAVGRLGLRYVVLTSVTRDDLPDGGAGHFASTLRALHEYSTSLKVEVLVSDFQGTESALKTVLTARPRVLAHNLETVPRLYPTVRPDASFSGSIQMLRRVRELDSGVFTKSGLMLGLGEEREEVSQTMASLRGVGCDFLTLGQYLRPSPAHHPVVRFVTPAEFEEYRRIGLGMGFRGVASGPLVRSSFHAASLVEEEKDSQTA
ncbi:MAG: lipoyl synthase [Dehalococcoidia bacterium]|nr:lipoyl synthase [Dehalococcoidia bacterium]MDP7469217.1 lipoyl synthase [Dehalococcoidia bacterium]